MRVCDTETMRVLLCLGIEEWFWLSFGYLRNKPWLEIHVSNYNLTPCLLSQQMNYTFKDNVKDESLAGYLMKS